MRRIFSLMAALMLILSMGVMSVLAQSEQSGMLRFVHAIPGVTAVDIYTDGQLTVSGLGYGDASGYVNIPSGSRDIVVRPRGLTTVLWQQSINVSSTPQTLIASTIDPLQFVPFDDDFTPLPLGQTRLKIVHAVANGPAVDLFAGEDAIIQGLTYGQSIGTFDIEADVYSISATTSGDQDSIVLSATPFSLVSGTSQMIVIYGTPTIPEVMVLSTATGADESSGFVRVAHGVADAPEVDIYADGVLLVPNLSFGDVTEHLAIPEGDYELELRVGGTTETLLTDTLTIEADVAQTVVALGPAADLSVATFADEIGAVTAEAATISVVNTIPGNSTVTVTLADGTVLASDLASGEASAPLNVDPGTQAVRYELTIDGDTASLELIEQALYGGVYYNVLLTAGSTFTPPALVFAPTSLAQGVASAPGADDVIVAAPPPAVEEPVDEPVVEEPAETEVETVDEPEAPPEVVTEAPAEDQPAAPVLVQPQPTPEPLVPTARILLDPGANLQLRQYPSPEALSLGLAPSGTMLRVNGREGAPVDLEGNELQIEDEGGNLVDWEDPVELLEDERDDLVPAETWLNVTYNTPDGGRINAWINALYIELRAADGDRLRLAELATIPANRPGEAIDTEITPPPIPENVVSVRVVNLDPGINLNLRRTPERTGEVLARLPNGTVMEFLGLGESGNWVFVRLTPAEGGVVTGWVATQYTVYEYNGRLIELEEMEQRNLLQEADEETQRGTISANLPAVATPTPDPQRNAYIANVEIDPGANLNLRRTPTDQAEVLQRIPSGTRLIIEARTEDGEWLQTSFEGQIGWISSGFVSLTFNQARVELEEIPVFIAPEPEEDEDETTDQG